MVNSNNSVILFGYLDRIQPVALASSDFSVAGGVAVTVSGWGRTSQSSSVSQTLNYVALTTITNQQCANVYGSTVIVDSSICAVGNPHHSTCSVSPIKNCVLGGLKCSLLVFRVTAVVPWWCTMLMGWQHTWVLSVLCLLRVVQAEIRLDM